jgi:hypothetical protein
MVATSSKSLVFSVQILFNSSKTMTKSNSEKPTSQFQQFDFSEESSLVILRAIGYGLIVLALFDWIEIFAQPNFMNPAWEFQTIGALVERIPVTFIGLGLVFYGEMRSRTKWEYPLLKVLSWLTLLLAVVFFLMIPLGIADTVRLNKQSTAQITTASTQQISQAENLEKQLSQATPEQINTLLKQRGGSLNGKNPEEFKTELLSKVSQAKAGIKDQAKTAQSTKGFSLIKTSLKWNLGALVSSVLFISIWKGTRWIRKM